MMTDWAAMAASLQAVRDDNATTITIRRRGATLAAQTVRIARLAKAARRQAGAEEVAADVLVAGNADLDIQVDDRFTDNGLLYQVLFVRPNRQAGTQAEAKVIE